jgi:hypothetical protein
MLRGTSGEGTDDGVLEWLCYLFDGEKTKEVYHHQMQEHKKEDTSGPRWHRKQLSPGKGR